jgi:hypothetical protein
MNKYGKCGKFPKDNENFFYLVNGKADPHFQDYYYCETARSIDNMCGPAGKLFESK